MRKIWKLLTEVVSMAWLILRGRDPLEFEIPPVEVPKRPTPKPPEPEQPTLWEHVGISYTCYCCDASEHISTRPDRPTADDMHAFWTRWGKGEESHILVYDPRDRSFTPVHICPACQKRLKEAEETGKVKKYEYGYDATELALQLRGPKKQRLPN